MIKTIRNSNNNRVIGISINGKRYSISKEVCNALSNEEFRAKSENEKISSEAKRISKELQDIKFIGSSENLNVSLKFNSDNTINHQSSSVEFHNYVTKADRELALSYINSFVDALNTAQKKRNKEYESKIINKLKAPDKAA